MAKKKKPKPEKIDGLSPNDIKRIRSAIRQVWHWCYPKKLCVQRCTRKNGFQYCEKCKKKVPKIFVDHITQVGDVDAGFIARLFCPSSGLQGLCKSCHQSKTNDERRAAKRKTVVQKIDRRKRIEDFY